MNNMGLYDFSQTSESLNKNKVKQSNTDTLKFITIEVVGGTSTALRKFQNQFSQNITKTKHKSTTCKFKTLRNIKIIKKTHGKCTKIENLKIMQFDTFEDPPKAPKSVFTKQY